MDSNIANPHDVYEKAETYWSRCSQDLSAMLGGCLKLQEPDIARSKQFLEKLIANRNITKVDNCLDCGAGIGRVTRDVLMPYFTTVDMVDIIEEFLVKASEYIGTDDGIGNKYVEGLQTFDPEVNKYDMIWIQWVSGHLNDNDLRAFLKRCVVGLAPGGMVVIKDNVLRDARCAFDDSDYSWTRSEQLLLEIARDAGLVLRATCMQLGFPRGMQTVRMFAFSPFLRKD